jgi:hypothetical protein
MNRKTNFGAPAIMTVVASFKSESALGGKFFKVDPEIRISKEKGNANFLKPSLMAQI